jgi:hypothetical protein
MTVTEPAPVVDPPADRPRGRHAWEPWLLVAVVVGYVIARVDIWLHARVFIAGDSASYAPRGDTAIDHGPLVSLVGNSPRPWGVPLFYALAPTDSVRVAMQFAVGSGAWALLAYALWRRTDTPVGRFLAAAGVLTVAMATSVTSWDYMVLSESLSITLGVLVLGILLLLLEKGSWALAAALAAAAIWWMFTRPDLLLFVATLVAVLAILAWRGRHRHRRYAAVAVVLLLGIGWFAATAPAVDRNSAAYTSSGESQSSETTLYRLYLQVLPNPPIRATYEHDLGMPSCPAAEQVDTVRWDIVAFARAYRSCPDLVRWAQRQGSTSAFRFVLASPDGYAKLLGSTLPEELSGNVYQYGQSFTVLPPPLQRAVFPPTRVTGLWTVAALAGAAIAVALTRAWRRRGVLVLAGGLIAAAALASAAGTVLFSAGAYSRYGIQEAVLLRVGLVILLVAAVDSLAARRRRANTDQGVATEN